jgi:hypothetical protein
MVVHGTIDRAVSAYVASKASVKECCCSSRSPGVRRAEALLRKWSQRLLTINPNVSFGLQFMQGKSVIAGLKSEYDGAKALQEG